MVNTLETRIKDIKKVIRNLDITPTMFKNAEEKYKNIAKYLNEHGLNVDISLQGSFAIGTATKPYSDGKDKEYDIDVICLFNNSSTSSFEIRDKLISTLNSSEIYSNKTKEWPKCLTIEYSQLGDYDFSIDLVPTTIDTSFDLGECVNPKYLTDVFKIATKDSTYGWYTINPKGYQQWFNDINQRFALYDKEQRMKMLFEENKQVYASVEDIPEYFNKSSLQEAIQILKRIRDIYFSKIQAEKFKPASIIITTFAALVAKDCPTNIDSVALAYEIIKKLKLYSTDDIYHNISSPIIKKGSKWEFLNPVNSKDNLIDSWNEKQENSELFFKWVKKTYDDLDKIMDINSHNYLDVIGNSFGNEIVDKLFERKKPQQIIDGAKPYHE